MECVLLVEITGIADKLHQEHSFPLITSVPQELTCSVCDLVKNNATFSCFKSV